MEKCGGGWCQLQASTAEPRSALQGSPIPAGGWGVGIGAIGEPSASECPRKHPQEDSLGTHLPQISSPREVTPPSPVACPLQLGSSPVGPRGDGPLWTRWFSILKALLAYMILLTCGI